MGSQFWLVLLCVACAVTLNRSANAPPSQEPSHQNSIDDVSENLIDHIKAGKRATVAPGSKHDVPAATKSGNFEMKKTMGKIPLALDPRFNKMLPQTNLLKDEAKDSGDDDDSDEDDLDDYYEDYYEDDDTNSTEVNKPEVNKKTITEKPKKLHPKLKPIKGDDKPVSDKTVDSNDSDDDDDDDYDDDDEDDDISDDDDMVYSQKVPCPRDCICARNLHSFMVATCSRLDSDVQKFGADISDLVVVDVGPKYPILLGPEFFVKVGLKHVSTIKISNCTVEQIHPTAFHGLDELYAVNLTSVGLSTINPNTFEQNKRLRLLTISGNDLSVMTRRGSTATKYLINSSSVEELDLSNNNLNDIPETAFTQLTNIVYINLSNNNIKTLPEKLFDSVETIEDLDLSVNNIVTLPPNIFNRTALAMLHLHHNDITGDLRFGTSDLQQLDLSFCSILHVNNHMFSEMKGLTTLNLKGNGLNRIQPDSFLALKNLRHIDLSTNDLDQVSSLLFYMNTDLDVIRLYDNPRLSELPPDGFQSVTGDFNTYLLDISNCAISSLGRKTFTTMPHLTTLKLSWNNINNLDKGTFLYLKKLTELDLSNNLIVKLHDQTFLHNRDLSKLILSGNPIQELSSNLLYPIANLRVLDVSDCELKVMLTDNNIELPAKFYETLKFFNISHNKIKNIPKIEVQSLRNLQTFDISNNLLKCNEDFMSLMKYLNKKNIVSEKVLEKANLMFDEDFEKHSTEHAGWDEFASGVCKRPITLSKASKKEELIRATPKTTVYKKVSNEKNKIFESLKEAEETDNDDDSEYDDDEYDDDVDENSGEDTKEKHRDLNLYKDKTAIKDNGLYVDEINVIKETKDKFLRGKLLPPDEDDADEEDNEIIIRTTKVYYRSGSLLPMLIVLLSVIVLLAAIGKIVSILMRKRGERYRMALLATKNSIIYQKLSEDIAAEKFSKNPKVHRYAQINQV